MAKYPIFIYLSSETATSESIDATTDTTDTPWTYAT